MGAVYGEVRDALKVDEEPNCGRYDGVISAMLAEHLLNPAPLFATMVRRLAPDGFGFFSTALESPQRDQIFECNWESRPLQMAEAAGLRAERMASAAAAVPKGSRFLPRATDMILRSR
jgi:2-polyprenyl-3-methyl-5-hydroxy-6-metoxy-1,4-benzoquinol methylase